jgi:hypothetical protein
MSAAVPIAEIVVIAAGSVVCALAVAVVYRSFRSAARKTSPDALTVVLNPAAVAERAESEFTRMLQAGELSREQYRTLIASLAEDSSSIKPPARSAGTDRRQAS